MRVIKFRGKTTNGEWVYGHYSTGGFIHPDGTETVRHLIHADMLYDVDSETVGQFTERFDKNGNEIYEGDIVKTNNGVGFVRYNAKQWFYEVAEVNEPLDNERKPGGIPEEDWEVLGNIHDNPELLK